MYGVIRAKCIRGSAAWGSRPKPWVAHLTGLDSHFGFAREFVRGVYDYTYATKSGLHGVYLYFAIPPGLYEVYWPISWKHEYRGFRRVDEFGNVHDIEREEVIECLKNVASE